MPWCERCDRFLNPNTVTPEGACPSCGRPVERPQPARTRGAGEEASPTHLASEPDGDRAEALEGEPEEELRAPWHFWVMIVAVVLYLGWRLAEGIWWLLQQAF